MDKPNKNFTLQPGYSEHKIKKFTAQILKKRELSNEEKKNFVAEPSFFGELSARVEVYLKEYYQSLNIDQRSVVQEALPKNYFFEAYTEDHLGISDQGSIEIATISEAVAAHLPEDIKKRVEEINKINVVRIFAHESYHSAGKDYYGIGGGRNGFLKRERSGLNYRSPRLTVDLKPNNAIEEGLAVLFEFNFMQAQSVSEYGESLQEYREQVELLKANTHQNVPFESIGLITRPPHYEVSAHISYPNSVNLVKYLIDVFMEHNFNFIELCERGRTANETVSLARAFRKVFGMWDEEKTIEMWKKVLGYPPIRHVPNGLSLFALVSVCEEKNAANLLSVLKIAKTVKELN